MLSRISAALAVLALGVLPLTASATSVVSGTPPAVVSPATLSAGGPVHITYNTELDTEPFGGFAGEYDGRLDATFYPSGIIQGNYRDLDVTVVPIPITGGFDAKTGKVWLDLRPLGGEHIEGEFTDVGISGTTFIGRVGIYNHFDNQFRFQAVPAPNRPLVGR